MAAFTSRSRTELHSGQVHSRSLSASSLLMYPQQLQVFDDGAKRPIRRMFLPCHSALYSSIVTKVDQLASFIACAKLWFLTILLTDKVSSAIVWFSRINLVETLCKKSLRLFVTFSCSKARRCFVLLPLFFEYLRCTYFNLDCAFRKFLGFLKISPSEVIAKSLIPKSIPIVVFSLIGTLIGISVLVSTNMETKYLPVGVTLMVALLIAPFISLCRTISIPSLNFGIIKRLFSTITFCGIEKDCFPLCFDLYFGKPEPLKNLLKAISILCMDCCKDWLFTSFSHSHSFLSSGSCLIRSKAEKLCLGPKYAVIFVSKARLYTKRLLPICLAINPFCVSLGYRRYLNALNMLELLQKSYQFIQNRQNVKTIQNGSAKGVAYIPPTLRRWPGFMLLFIK